MMYPIFEIRGSPKASTNNNADAIGMIVMVMVGRKLFELGLQWAPQGGLLREREAPFHSGNEN